jgi:hypothetical protein
MKGIQSGMGVVLPPRRCFAALLPYHGAPSVTVTVPPPTVAVVVLAIRKSTGIILEDSGCRCNSWGLDIQKETTEVIASKTLKKDYSLTSDCYKTGGIATYC